MEEPILGRLDRIIAILESIASMGSHLKTEHAAVTERLQAYERRLDEQEKGRIPSGNGGEYLAALVTLALAVITAIFYVYGLYATDIYWTQMGFHIHQFPELTDFAAVVSVGGSLLIIKIMVLAFILIFVWLLIRHVTKKTTSPLATVFWGGLFVLLALIFMPDIVRHQATEMARERIKAITHSSEQPPVRKAFPRVRLVPENGAAFCPPGVRVICSESFCGFRHSDHTTLISLAGIRSISTDVADCPAEPQEGEAKPVQRP